MATAYITHADYALHTLDGHPEHAGRIEAIWKLIDASDIAGDLLRITPQPAADADLLLVHDQAHLEMINRVIQRGGGMIDPDTYVLPASDQVGRLTVGGIMAAAEAVLSGQAANAFAAVRPPGHHVTPTRAMGFGIYNNVAIAARHVQQKFGLGRVLIVDYDVHHGNGTQDAFYSDPSILYVSSHQYPYYPGSGARGDIGSGPGMGFTLNMPVPAGVGSPGLAELYTQIVWPAARRFKPEMILVSAGFDAHWVDSLASLLVDLSGYAHLTRELITMAGELCGGRIVFALEGGYDLEAVSHASLNVLYALLGRDQISDPIGPPNYPTRPVDRLLSDLKELHDL